MTPLRDWAGETGKCWAESSRDTDRSLAGITQPLLEQIGREAGEAVLDIGCGAGELTIAIARSRPAAQFVGVDISSDLVDAARGRAAGLANACFVHADAADWDPAGFAPDLLVSRHGVMFFADPVAAFRHLRAIARPGARLVFSCFRSPRENAWMTDIQAMMPQDAAAPPPDPFAPCPFAFADPKRVAAILDDAGWLDVSARPADFDYLAGAGEDAADEALSFLSRIGPAAMAMATMTADEREEIRARLRRWIDENCMAGRVAFPAAAWIVGARNR